MQIALANRREKDKRKRGEELMKLGIEGTLSQSFVEASVWNYVLMKERRTNHQLLQIIKRCCKMARSFCRTMGSVRRI
jgi:hypothetical protein